MTLEELHNQLEDKQREMTQNRFMYSESEIEFNGELIITIEALRIYKKALEMLAYDTAYEPMGNLDKRIAFRKEHAQENIAKYLQKARVQNDDN